MQNPRTINHNFGVGPNIRVFVNLISKLRSNFHPKHRMKVLRSLKEARAYIKTAKNASNSAISTPIRQIENPLRTVNHDS